jgi:hypothetical protein
MKYFFTSILFFSVFLSASQTLKKERKLVQVVSPQTYYLNGGTRATFGGKSRTMLKIDLPKNTIEWYYSFSTNKGQNSKIPLNLFGELTRIYDPSGLTAIATNKLISPTGANVCDVYLMNRKNADAFMAKVDNLGGSYNYYLTGSRENFRNGVVQIKDNLINDLFLGFKNPSLSEGISVTVEVVAIIEEVTIEETTWNYENKEQVKQEILNVYNKQNVELSVAVELANCITDKLKIEKTFKEYSEFTNEQKATHFTLLQNDCAKSLGLIKNESEEKGVTYGNLGWKSYTNGDIDKAIEWSLKALNYDNSLGFVKFNLGLFYMIKGDENLSVDYYVNGISDTKKQIKNVKQSIDAGMSDINEALKKYPNINGFQIIKSLLEDELKNIR